MFYLVAVFGSAIGGILALLFSQMAGLGNEAAWRWIFIMEGIITCVIAVFGYIYVVDFPQDGDKARGFLTTQEKDFVIRHLNRDRHDADTSQWTTKEFMRAALDIKLWAFALAYLWVLVDELDCMLILIQLRNNPGVFGWVLSPAHPRGRDGVQRVSCSGPEHPSVLNCHVADVCRGLGW